MARVVSARRSVQCSFGGVCPAEFLKEELEIKHYFQAFIVLGTVKNKEKKEKKIADFKEF